MVVGLKQGAYDLICTWFSWCHCHAIISCFIKSRIAFTFVVPAYPDCPGKEAVKQMFVSLFLAPVLFLAVKLLIIMCFFSMTYACCVF